ncbi:MAG TPA: S-layer homology domain-containing protein [Chloroflexia bacterium]|nr:S-layer homology domain-containing protein [Chloroflexia bacterium]
MSDHIRSVSYRWVIAIVALVMVFGIGAGNGGTVTNASTMNTGKSATQATTGNSEAPGADPDKLATQNQAGMGQTGTNDAPSVSCPSGQCFTDVNSSNTFYAFVNNIYLQGLVTGYPCDGVGEPCDSANRPYYRPAAQVSRGQMSKFIDNARNLAGINIVSGAFPISSVSDQPNGAGIQGFGTVQDGTGVLGSGSGTGPVRSIFNMNTGGYFVANGANNSVGAVLYGVNDNATWIQSDSAVSYAAYIVNAKGGIGVGDPGNDPQNHVSINGPLVVGGGCTGCTLLTIMQNTGETDLHPGQVASMSSAITGPAMVGDQPLVGVDIAQGAYNSAVVGVVAHRWVPADPNAPAGTILNTGYYDYDATTIKPGEYMGVATTGAYKEVQVSAANGPIHVGDLLVTSDTAGVAMKATDKMQAVGATLGKAMGNLETGTGVVPVMLTLK